MDNSSFLGGGRWCAMIGLFVSFLTVGGQTTVANYAPLPNPTPWQITKRDANHRVWERIVYEKSPDGQAVAKKRSYLELAGGICYKNSSGQWLDSQEQIQPYATGAIAQQGQYQTIFANDLNSAGAIDQQTPDGKRLRSNILGLAYYDYASGQSVLIAHVQDSQGELISANQVLYPHAFNGVNADVRYTYKRGSFEQDVILREQPPTPESVGLSSSSTEIEVLTEFLDPPSATILEHQNPYNGMLDDDVSWGVASLGHGKAFDLGRPLHTPPQIHVRRQYQNIQGRTILIEGVLLPQITGALSHLPLQSRINDHSRFRLTKSLMLPHRPLAQKVSRPIEVARSSPSSSGFVLDYVEVNASETNFIFQGDTTYFVSGEYALLGTTVIEGGSVIKMNDSGQLDIDVNGNVVCQTASYRPAIFTSMNDDTVAESISGSSGIPSPDDVGIFLDLNNTNAALSNFRFAYCIVGVFQPEYPSFIDIWDSQFASLDVAIYGGGIKLHNVLIANSGYYGDPSIWGDGPTFMAENVTSDGGNSFYYTQYGLGSNILALTNCIISGQALVEYPATTLFFTNTSVWLPRPTTPIYETVGGAGYYLTNNSPYHNAGISAISPSLISDLATKTTYPPLDYSGATILFPTIFGPQAQRDSLGNPDLGYHYDPLDYVFGGSTANANILFTAGTAVGWFNGGPGEGVGILINGNAQATFAGTATSPCVFARNNVVQESVNGNWTAQSYLGGFVGVGGNYNPATAPTVNLQFTRCYAHQFDGNFFRDEGDGTLTVVNANNCEFYDGGAGGYLIDFNCTNCLSVRNVLGSTCDCSPSVTMVNCTFFGGALSADRWYGATWPLVVENCAFAGTSFDGMNDPSAGNTNITWCNFNSYLTTDGLAPGQGSHFVTVSNYNWQTSWLGNYYLPSASPLIAVGSTTANLLGLYHFTTQINQIPETNAVVDIGYHYVATDVNGAPISTPNDGIPDYLADANGNGLADPGEISWTDYVSTNSLVSGNGLVVFTPLK